MVRRVFEHNPVDLLRIVRNLEEHVERAHHYTMLVQVAETVGLGKASLAEAKFRRVRPGGKFFRAHLGSRLTRGLRGIGRGETRERGHETKGDTRDRRQTNERKRDNITND